MMSPRASIRNIRFYDASTSTEEPLGGLYQQGSVTEASFVWMITSVILIGGKNVTVIQHRQSGRNILDSMSPIEAVVPGEYDIFSQGPISVSDEPWMSRVISFSESGRQEAFQTGVRERDRKCVISGITNPFEHVNWWPSFHAAHVFPLEHEGHWLEYGYSRWITNMDDAHGHSKINSVQNGFLMQKSLHDLFDQYLFSINPDDGYKIISFQPDVYHIDGRILDPACRDPNNPNHVCDQLLRWHFRQSVLANMRGAGEPLFESDFPPGSDKLETLRSEPYGKERLEMELALRLRDVQSEGVEAGD